MTAVDLRPYVPRLLLEWGASGGPTYRQLHGSAVFADVSGFTRLSERLGRLGQVGSEELTIALDGIFDALLTAALAYGGSMVKFGGDAVLLLFWDEDHELRAAASALAMQRAIVEAGRVQTPAGPVRLRMSVGVDSGTFDLFLVGDRHRELLVAGPAASAVCALETAASAGQIVGGDSIIASVLAAGGLAGGSVPPGRVIRRLKGVDPVPPVDVPDNDASPFVPEALRRHLAAGGHDPEHRTTAVAFVGFGGVDELIAAGRAAEAADHLHTLVCAAQQVASDLEVAFLASDVAGGGGKLILAAGAPNSVEDQDERIVRAVRSVVEAGSGLGARAGIHRGPVFAGDVGPAFRRTYTILGDTVNTAARVLARAAPGQVLATPEVLSRTETVFRADPVPPFMAKGKALPLHAAVVGEPSGRSRRAIVPTSPLIGRDAELRLLLDAGDQARRGRGAAIELVAEPGFGKTRLAEETIASLADCTAFWIRSDAYDTGVTWKGARTLLLAMLGGGEGSELASTLRMRVSVEAPELLPWLPLVAAVLGIGVDPTPEVEQLPPGQAHGQVLTTLVDLLAAVLKSPTVIVADDTQWLDPASSEVLAALAARSGSLPWVLIATRRPDGGTLNGASTVELRPLTAAAAADVAFAAGDGRLLPQVADEIAERAGGVPLFILELVTAELERTGSGTGNVTDDLAQLVAARIDRLSPPDRQVLRSLAVLGGSFSKTLAESLLELPPGTWGRLGGLLETGGEVAAFRQPVFHEIAYAGLPHRQRRRLHAAAAELIESKSKPGEEPAELLALHFGRAGDDEQAFVHARAAAESAERRWAHLSAARWYATAAAHAARSSRPAGVIGACRHDEGRMFLQVGDHAAAGRALAAARRRTTAPGELARLALLDGEVAHRTGRYRTALRWYQAGLRHLDHIAEPSDDDVRNRPRLLLGVATVRTLQGRWKAAIAAATEAAHRTPESDQSGQAFAWFLLHQAHLRLGVTPPEPYAENALAVYEELGDNRLQARILNTMGMDAHMHGDWDRAIDCYGRSRAALLTAGDHLPAAAVANNLAEILVDQGRPDEALPIFGEALAVARAAGQREYSLVITANLARVAAMQGRFADADQSFEEALAGFQAMGADGHALEARTRVAERLLLENRAEEALEAAEALAGSVSPALRPRVLRVRGESLAALGRLEDARAALHQAVDAAVATDARRERELASLALRGLSERVEEG